MKGSMKKLISILLVICFMTVNSGVSAFGATIQLTMPLCVSLAISKNKELLEIKSEIRDLRDQISAIRGHWSSLLFWKNLSYTWNDWMHYTTEIELYSQIPDLESQIKELMLNELSIRLEIKDTVQQAYYDVIENIYLVEMKKNETETLTQSIARLNYQKMQNQNIDENDLVLAREKLADSKTEQENQEANLQDAKKRLGDAMDMDVQYGYTFASQFYSDMMEDGSFAIDLSEAIDYAVLADHDSGMKYYEYQGARTLVQYVEGRYQKKFGYTLWRIRDYLR